MIYMFCIIKYLLYLKGLQYPGFTTPGVVGKIFSLDMKDPRMKPVELRMPRNFDLESFNPHGISVYTDPTGKTQNNLHTCHTHKSLQDSTFRVNTVSHGLYGFFSLNQIH